MRSTLKKFAASFEAANVDGRTVFTATDEKGATYRATLPFSLPETVTLQKEDDLDCSDISVLATQYAAKIEVLNHLYFGLQNDLFAGDSYARVTIRSVTAIAETEEPVTGKIVFSTRCPHGNISLYAVGETRYTVVLTTDGNTYTATFWSPYDLAQFFSCTKACNEDEVFVHLAHRAEGNKTTRLVIDLVKRELTVIERQTVFFA